MTVQRRLVWKRTIVVSGPEEWVLKTRLNSLADGHHNINVKDGYAIDVETDHITLERAFPALGTTNGKLAEVATADPTGWDEIHSVPDETPASGGYDPKPNTINEGGYL